MIGNEYADQAHVVSSFHKDNHHFQIDRHYQLQRDALGDADPELSAHIADFQADEVEHRDTAAEMGGTGFPVMSALIRAGCRLAISVSQRI